MKSSQSTRRSQQLDHRCRGSSVRRRSPSEAGAYRKPALTNLGGRASVAVVASSSGSLADSRLLRRMGSARTRNVYTRLLGRARADNSKRAWVVCPYDVDFRAGTDDPALDAKDCPPGHAIRAVCKLRGRRDGAVAMIAHTRLRYARPVALAQKAHPARPSRCPSSPQSLGASESSHASGEAEPERLSCTSRRRIAARQDAAAFACGNATLDNWLRRTALTADAMGTARTGSGARHRIVTRRVTAWYDRAMAEHYTLRLASGMRERLSERARRYHLPERTLAQRYVEEGLRHDAHPLIQFLDGPCGRRAGLIGSGLDVLEVIATVRDNDGSVLEAGAYLEIPVGLVEAAVAYYGEYRDEIDEQIQLNEGEYERGRAAAANGERALRT